MLNVPGTTLAAKIAAGLTIRSTPHRFSAGPVIAVTVLFSLSTVIAVKRNITGDPSPWRERVEVKQPHNPPRHFFEYCTKFGVDYQDDKDYLSHYRIVE
jgi:hypothetical protein